MTRSALFLANITQANQFGGNLTDSFDFRQVVNRGDILVGKIVDNVKLVLEAVADQFPDEAS